MSVNKTVASTRSRTAKVAALAELLRALDPSEVEVAVGFLTGVPRQGRIGVGWRSAYRHEVVPATEPSVEVLELDRILTELAGTAGPGSQGRRQALLSDLFSRCTEAECDEFLRTVPEFERMLVRSGIIVIKYWFSITDDEQHFRFMMRIHDPLKQWKLSPMDMESRRRWEAYTKAKEAMLERTHIPEAPWWVVEADDKKKARLNCIHHLLQQIPYNEVQREPVVLPSRIRNPDYLRGPVPKKMYVPAVY